MLAILTAVKWIQANWKLVAIAAILAGTFASGWAVRGYIAEAAQNKAIAAAIEQTKIEERGLYEKARKIEEAKRRSREKARIDNARLAESLIDSECLDAPVIPAQWVQVIREAIADGASKP